LWRSIAAATPDIWTSLCISLRHRHDIRPRDSATVRQYKELATQWFSRAGPDLGLSLQLEDSIFFNDFSNIIISRPERFRELKINLPSQKGYPNSSAYFIRGRGNPSYAFTQLEDLTIVCSQPGVVVSFAAAGRLRRMIAKIPFDSWEQRKNFAPWQQLSCLEIGSLKGSVLVPLFAQCINLENGTFKIGISIDPIPTVNVTMAHLISLTMKFTLMPLAIELFDGFRLPALTSLDIESGYGTSGSLVQFLRHTPSLTHLCATINSNLDPLPIGLTVTNQSNPLVPELKQLTIQPRWNWSGSRPPSARSLLMMVASRMIHHHASPCPLEYLAIVIPAAELYGNGGSDLERQLHTMQMSRSDDRVLIPYRMMNGELVVKQVWRQAI